MSVDINGQNKVTSRVFNTFLFGGCDWLFDFVKRRSASHKSKLERAVDGALLQITKLKFFYPKPPSPTLGV